MTTVKKLESHGSRKLARSPLWAAVQGVHRPGQPNQWPLLPVELVGSPRSSKVRDHEMEPKATKDDRIEDEPGFAQFIGCLKGQVRINGSLLSTGVKWDATR